MAAAPEWIVCRGATRSVIDGGVLCPQPDLVAWQRCVECRLLEALDDDRTRGCGDLAEPEPPGEIWAAAPAVGAERITELL